MHRDISNWQENRLFSFQVTIRYDATNVFTYKTRLKFVDYIRHNDRVVFSTGSDAVDRNTQSDELDRHRHGHKCHSGCHCTLHTCPLATKFHCMTDYCYGPLAQPSGGHGPPEIGFTRKFLAAPLSWIHKIAHGLAARAFQFGQKKFLFDSIRFSLPNRFFRFDSIRQSDKFAASTLIFK